MNPSEPSGQPPSGSPSDPSAATPEPGAGGTPGPTPTPPPAEQAPADPTAAEPSPGAAESAAAEPSPGGATPAERAAGAAGPMEPSAGAPLPGDQSASSGYEPQSGARPSWQSGGGPPPYGQPPYPTPGGPPPGGPHYPTPAYGAEPPRRSRAWIGWLVGACAVVLVLCCGGGGLVAYHYWSADGDSTPHGPGPSHGPTGSAASGACRYPSDGQQPAREVRTPDPESAVPTTATLVTNRGTITVRLAADKAPCTLRSLASLARQGFYDDSPCHRLTTRGLWIVQCGDPSGTGRGGPGYTVPDENMPTGGGIAYPRGTVALANTGESGTGGSQFFICYRDDDLPPSYAVVGTVSAGMSVVDGVAAGGEVDETGPGDGKPRLPLTITSMTTH